MQRRTFLQSMAVTGAGFSLASVVSCQSESSVNKDLGQLFFSDEKASQYFPQSILSAEPRATSVVLWTRLAEVDRQKKSLPLVLQMAKSEQFQEVLLQFEVVAEINRDGCVSIKVSDLDPNQHYYYRFIFPSDGKNYSSKIGRTKTAPVVGQIENIKFAQVCCQDYVGRYYNSYWKLLEQDNLDFVLFLGDYVYETTRDPRFQTDSSRKVEFNDIDGAIKLGSEETPFYAARSLNNYRQLYQIYRSDPLLQKVHEKFPMIAIWDDHEFADDSYGMNSTHHKGRKNEADLERKLNSEQAFFEFMPVDLNEEESSITQSLKQTELNRFPDTQIYRSFNFGSNLDLIVSDYRTYRPEHLIPEEAFPGTIIFNETALQLLLSTQGIDFKTIKQYFASYVDIDSANFIEHKKLLKEALLKAYYDEGLNQTEAMSKVSELVAGNLSISVVNQWLPKGELQIQKGEAHGTGFSYGLLGKLNLFGEVGSRYFVVKQAYDLLASASYVLNSNSQNALGQRQEFWLKNQLFYSTANWKVLANSVSMNSLLLDLREEELKIPEPYNQLFYMNVDHWDGFPDKRQELLESFSSVNNMVLLSGDIHAGLVGHHKVNIKEFTAPALSSSTQKKMIGDTAKKDPVLAGIPRLEELLKQANELMLKANEQLEYAEMTKNGVVIHQVSAEKLITDYWLIPEYMTTHQYYSSNKEVLDQMARKTFVTNVTSPK